MESDQFLLGFIAGEGSFFVGLFQRDSGKVEARPKFVITVDEYSIVEKSYHKLNEVGQVLERGNGMTTWQVQSFDDAQSVRQWVEKNRNVWFDTCHKAEQFELWCEAIDILQQDEVTDVDKKRLVDISYEIPRSNTKRTPKDVWYQRIDDWEQHYCVATRDDGEGCEMPVPEPDMLCHHHQ